MYIVLYNKLAIFNEAGTALYWNGNSTVYSSPTRHTLLNMKDFTEEQDAIDFAKKNDGFIVIPATIKSEIVDAAKEGK